MSPLPPQPLGNASTLRVNSKLQFYRKFGGERRARQAKALLALAYAPRAAAASAVALVRPAWRPRARTWRRLLAELPGM